MLPEFTGFIGNFNIEKDQDFHPRNLQIYIIKSRVIVIKLSATFQSRSPMHKDFAFKFDVQKAINFRYKR